jgi:two-component system response regulator (stage 0 sporulation protein F)
MKLNKNNSSLKVLIVDDQPGVRMLLEETFKYEDCCVYTAQDGIEALKKFDEIIPDIIFIDYKMPVMNGIEVIKEISQKEYDVKVVLMTAYGEITNINKIEVDDFLTKPFDIQDAKDILHKLFAVKKNILC